MLMWWGDMGPLSRCMPGMAGRVFAHGGPVAKSGEPASNMALTYQIHLWQSAFPEIKYCYNDKMLTYGPGNMFYRPTRTVYSHSISGEQFYLALILLKVIWVEAIFFDNFSVSIFAEKSKTDETSSIGLLKSSHPIMANKDEKISKIPTSYSPTAALTRWTQDYYATALFLKRDYFMTS